MQIVVITGNLTRDPESRSVGDKTVCNFTVAVNRRKKADGTQEADFFRVAAWGKLGENCQKYLAKGKKVEVVGTVSASCYQGNDGQARASLEMFAQNVEFLSPNGQSGEGGQAGSTTTSGGQYTAVETDELPF